MASTLEFSTYRIVEHDGSGECLQIVRLNDNIEAKHRSGELHCLVTALVYTFCVCVWCNKRFINYCII